MDDSSSSDFAARERDLTAQRDAAERKSAALQNDLENEKREAMALQKEAKDLKTQLQASNEQLTSAQQDVARQKEEIEAGQTERSELKKLIDETLRPRLAKLESDLEARVSELEGEAARRGKAELEVARLSEELSACEAARQELEKRNRRLVLEVTRLSGEVRSARREVGAKGNKERQLMEAMQGKSAADQDLAEASEQLKAALSRELEVRLMDFKLQRDSAKSFVYGSVFGPAAAPDKHKSGSMRSGSGGGSKRLGGRSKRRAFVPQLPSL